MPRVNFISVKTEKDFSDAWRFITGSNMLVFEPLDGETCEDARLAMEIYTSRVFPEYPIPISISNRETLGALCKLIYMSETHGIDGIVL